MKETAPRTRSGAASPAVRVKAAQLPVTIPGAAAGSTWPRTTCHRVAPRLYAASRNPRGTARMAARDVTITVGRASAASVQPPASRLGPMPMPRTKSASPATPYTTEGTPARFATAPPTAAVTPVRGAYSSR